MRSLQALIVALGLAMAASTAHAAPATATTLFDKLDPDAAVYAVVKPSAGTAFFAWTRRMQGTRWKPMVQKWIDETAASYQTALGFDATAGWGASGLDVDAPVVIAFGAIDLEATRKAFKARAATPDDAKSLAKAPRPFVRTRIIASVLDETKLRATLTSYAAATTTTDHPLVVVAGATPAALAAVVGVDAKAGKGVAAQLKKLKVVAIGRIHGGRGLVFVRLGGGLATVDAFALFGHENIDWKKDSPALAKLLARKIPKGGATARLAGPSGAALAAADVGVLVDPTRLLDLSQFGGWSKVLGATVGVADAQQKRSLLDTGEKEVAACDDFRPLASEGPFTAVALTARGKPAAVAGQPASLELAATWTLRAPGVLDAALATRDDGLVDLAAAGSGKLLALAPLAGTEGLRALPRPGVLAQELPAIDERMALCGWGAGVDTLLFGWLHYATLALDSSPQTQNAFRAARNLAVAVKSLGSRAGEVQIMALVSVGGDVLHGWYDQAFGKSKSQSVGKRKLTVWKSGQPRDPYGFATASTDGKSTVYGLAWGGDSTLSWWWGQPSPQSTGGTTAFVALVRTDLPWLLKNLGPDFGFNGAEELASNLGALRLLVGLSADALTATATIEVQ